jgi:hypothetical protein
MHSKRMVGLVESEVLVGAKLGAVVVGTRVVRKMGVLVGAVVAVVALGDFGVLGDTDGESEGKFAHSQLTECLGLEYLAKH